jgi:hypothetical protein
MAPVFELLLLEVALPLLSALAPMPETEAEEEVLEERAELEVVEAVRGTRVAGRRVVEVEVKVDVVLVLVLVVAGVVLVVRGTRTGVVVGEVEVVVTLPRVTAGTDVVVSSSSSAAVVGVARPRAVVVVSSSVELSGCRAASAPSRTISQCLQAMDTACSAHQEQ